MDGPGDILRVSAARHGDKPALVTAVRTLSYHELDTGGLDKKYGLLATLTRTARRGVG